jgi:hypothetical protein
VSDAELWLPVPGYDRYIVSELGRVARLLRPAPNSKGYMKVHLGRGNQFYVHQLVMLAFNGPPPPLHNVDHEDFNRGNNRLTNLRYMLKRDNDWRWHIHESDVDPAELARINAEYEALEAGGDIPSWAGGEAS